MHSSVSSPQHCLVAYDREIPGREHVSRLTIQLQGTLWFAPVVGPFTIEQPSQFNTPQGATMVDILDLMHNTGQMVEPTKLTIMPGNRVAHLEFEFADITGRYRYDGCGTRLAQYRQLLMQQIAGIVSEQVRTKAAAQAVISA